MLKVQALSGQKIYGFRTSENSTQILVFGGKQFTVVLIDCTDFKGITKLLEPIVCDDWLHDAVWIQKNEVAVLTAHNVVQVSTFCIICLCMNLVYLICQALSKSTSDFSLTVRNTY